MIKCENTNCKHHGTNNKCDLKKAVIGLNNKCKNFEKGFIYYFYYFETMSSNFILIQDLNDDMKYCIYYLMKCLPIEFNIYNNRGFLVLREINGDGSYLKADDIYNMIKSDKLNNEELHKCIMDFYENGLPKMMNNEENKKEKYEEKEFGWLSPLADWYESEWGTHEEKAYEIIVSNCWEDEYFDWCDKQPTCSIGRCGDFLSEIKGYVLIHNPSLLGGDYIVTNTKSITKKQRNFLYDYFMDMNMKLIAEKYLKD